MEEQLAVEDLHVPVEEELQRDQSQTWLRGDDQGKTAFDRGLISNRIRRR
jgi:hypothetical protein